jgi:CheW-like domain
MNGKWPGALTAEIIESLSDEEFWRYARELALLTPTETLPPEYLKCELSGGHRLIPMTSLYEVVPPPHRFALLPAIPAWMRGVFAWHTETIAVVDLDAYLSASQSVTGNDSEGNERASTGIPVPPDCVPSPLREPSPYGDPISHGRMESSTDTLLIADHSGLPIGLLVPTTGLTTTPESVSEHEESRSPILDLPVVLMDIVQQIRNSCPL